MNQLCNLTLAQALEGLNKGEFTSEELTLAYLERMELHRSLNAYITETPEDAISMAKASDARRVKGEAGLLEGIPLGIKDLFCTQGIRTTAGSKILENYIPAYESSVTRNLWQDGAVMLGKLNLDEFAMGSTTQTSAFGASINPWKDGTSKALTPGGSSGGSAAAVAAKLALGATGTDTGGSIRQPASFCGITGIKPTYGRCSRWGIVAFASSLDQAGPMAHTIEDCAIMLRSMMGHDPKDSTSIKRAVPDCYAALKNSIKGKRIGIPKEYRIEGMAQEIDTVWKQGIAWLKEAGAEIIDIDLPMTDKALAAYYIIAPAEASSNLSRYDGVRYGLRVEGRDLDDMYASTRGAGFGDEVKRRIMIGTYVLSAGYYDAYYNKARQVRKLISEDFAKAFTRVDAILTPTTPNTAFPLDESPKDPVTMYLNDVFTVPASMAGLPALSLPAGLSNSGLPLGLHLIGKPFAEDEILNIGNVIEDAARFRKQ